MNDDLARHINQIRKQNPGKEIIVVMHTTNWVNTFKCMTSFNDADIFVRNDIDEKEITIVPKALYNQKNFKS